MERRLVPPCLGFDLEDLWAVPLSDFATDIELGHLS
jgi:hypothetical protein